ncbi:MAG: hypothetical protein RBS13_06490 [Bacteroidales bacterium]|nr:hypothetical protein [Bacteroidales bacterium]
MTPSINEIANMLDMVEGKIRQDDDKWVNLAQSVVSQQNAYAAYQEDMKKKGVTDQKHDAYRPFAKWISGEPVKKDYSGIYGGPEGVGDGVPLKEDASTKEDARIIEDSSRPAAPFIEAYGKSDYWTRPGQREESLSRSDRVEGIVGADNTEVNIETLSRKFENLKTEELLFIRDQNSIKTEYRVAVTDELLKRDPNMKLAYPDQNLENIVDLVGKHDFDSIYNKYGERLIAMTPEQRRGYLRTEFGDGARSVARFIRHSVDTQRYKRAEAQQEGLSGGRQEGLASEWIELLSDLDNFEAAQRGSWVDNLGLGILNNLPVVGWLVKHGATKNGRSIADLDDILTDADFADTCEVLANEAGTVGAYLLIAGLFSKALDTMSGASKKGDVKTDTTSVKAYVRNAKKPPNMSASSPGVTPEVPSVVRSTGELSSSSAHSNILGGYTGTGSNPILNQYRENIRKGYLDARGTARQAALQSDLNQRLGVKGSSFRDMVDPTSVLRQEQQLRAINHIETNPLLRHKFLTEPTAEGRQQIIDSVAKSFNVATPTPVSNPTPGIRQIYPPSTPAVTPAPSTTFNIPDIFKKFKATADGKAIFDSGMLNKSTQLTQEMIDNAARIVQEGGKVTNGAVKQALLAAARTAAPVAMAAGAYYSPEAEDAMSQIVEQLAALGLE